MATTVRITVDTGSHKNRRFCFRGPARCTVGRASDCFVQFAGDERDLSISRHHCRLNIDPPCVHLQDLGSLNGTYRNGKKLEPGGGDLTDAAALLMRDATAVKDGDIITVGGTSFRIDIVDCPLRRTETTSDTPVWQESEVAKRDCPIHC